MDIGTILEDDAGSDGSPMEIKPRGVTMINTRLRAIMFCLSTLSAAAAQATDYYLSKIPVPQGATSVVDVVGIDSAGDLIGNVQAGSQVVPMKWSASASVAFQPGPDGTLPTVRFATAIGGGAGGNILWDSSGHAHPLRNPDPYGISNSGGSIGVTTVAGLQDDVAAIWQDPNTDSPTLLPFPPLLLQGACAADNEWSSLCYSYPQAMSPDGRFVVGLASSEPIHAQDGVLWVNGSPEDLGWNWYGAAVNNAGVVVGTFDTGLPPIHIYSGAFHAFSSDKGDLGTLLRPTADDAYGSSANAINASGTIVGASQFSPDDSAGTHAVVWQEGRILDLHAALVSRLPANTTLTNAYAISDNGQILVTATNTQTGASTPFIAGPIVPTHISIRSNTNPASYGQPIHLVASVIPDSGTKPLGQVTWYDNGKKLGTAGLTAIGTASWEPSTWTPGVHNVTVNFAGYAPDGASTSALFRQTIQATATKTTLGSSLNSITRGQNFTLTATVTSSFGTIAGPVVFKAGTTSLGTATLDGRTKQARLTATLKTTGKYAITAVYGGSTYFEASSSPPLAVTAR